MRRGAIIGVGNVALHGHLPGWLDRGDVAIVAAADADAARKSALAAHLPSVRWYESADALLGKEKPDFVDICTPPATHAAVIRSALRHGCHVLCEKPLVCRVEELDELASLASEKGRVLHTVHNWHHAPIIRFVRDLLRRGAIGEVIRCRWEVLRMQPAVAGDGKAGNWRLDPAVAGGGILIDHGWHAMYILHGWMGQTPAQVRATLETRRHRQYPLEDTATVQLRFPNATGEVFLTWAADERRTWAEIDGQTGSIRVEDHTVIVRQGHFEERKTFSPALSDGSHHPDWFGNVADEFLSSLSDSAMNRMNLAEASLCVRLLAAAQESSRQGGAWLSIGEMHGACAR